MTTRRNFLHRASAALAAMFCLPAPAQADLPPIDPNDPWSEAERFKRTPFICKSSSKATIRPDGFTEIEKCVYARGCAGKDYDRVRHMLSMSFPHPPWYRTVLTQFRVSVDGDGAFLRVVMADSYFSHKLRKSLNEVESSGPEIMKRLQKVRDTLAVGWAPLKMPGRMG